MPKITMPKITMDVVRSFVRICVTYIAAAYAFIGSGALIWWVLTTEDFNKDKFDAAKDLFMLVLPVATGVITYWFASRDKKKEPASVKEAKDNNTPDPK